MSGARRPVTEQDAPPPFPPPPKAAGKSTLNPGARLSAMSQAFTHLRRPPSPRRLARRRVAIRLTKLLLPSLALGLLVALALWPDLRRQTEQARVGLRRFAGAVHGDTLFEARYHGVDQQGQPFTVTAEIARQLNPDHVVLHHPKGDITLQGGSWMMLQSQRGVYRQNQNALDLSRDVTLYRDDGTTVMTDSAAIDLRRGAAAGAAPVHATGPFGKLTAQGGFTLLDRGDSLQFSGPVRLVLDGASR